MRIRSIVMTMVFVALASVASAQSLKIPAVFYGAAVAADIHSTFSTPWEGYQETNRLISWAPNKPTMLGAAIAVDTAIVAGLHHFVLRERVTDSAKRRMVKRRIEQIALLAAGSLRLSAAFHNYRLEAR